MTLRARNRFSMRAHAAMNNTPPAALAMGISIPLSSNVGALRSGARGVGGASGGDGGGGGAVIALTCSTHHVRPLSSSDVALIASTKP